MTGQSSPTPDVQVRADGPCGTIVLKSPLRRNATSRSMLSQLQQALDDLHQEAAVRAVVLTGHGNSFSSGSDLQEIAETMDATDADRFWFADANQQRSLLVAMLQYPKPIIAAVNGPARGFGLTLVAACDIVLASPEATFGFPEAQRGLTAGVAAPLIAFRIGAGRAAYLLLRGHSIGAEEAHQMGLVHQIVPFDLLWAQGREFANEIAAASPVAVAMTKRVLNEGYGEDILSHLTGAAAAMASARTTSHAEQGVRAFIEKRPPKWT